MDAPENQRDERHQPDGPQPAVEPHPIKWRELDLTSLKALAHPLRVKIIDTLSTYGSFTASGLAERLGESSGATSYHLRQLEKHGFVREDVTRGTGRERWWERPPQGISLPVSEYPANSAERAASDLVEQEWEASRAGVMRDYRRRGDELELRWRRAAQVSTSNLRLTSDQLAEFTREVDSVVERYTALYKKQDVPGSRPVQVQFNAFPVVDAPEIPGWRADGTEDESTRGGESGDEREEEHE
jgi:DNA-binding transcriptional ArsR family regulator